MAIIESDLGTKQATVLKIREILDGRDKKFKYMMYKFWQKVYYQAVQECPKETGALTASIRMKESQITQKGPNTIGIKAERDVMQDWYITAGGEGVVNPKHKREVDYAYAVHEGYKTVSGKWVGGNPFLRRAWDKSAQEFEKFVKEYLDWYEKTWAQGAPTYPPEGMFYMNIPVGLRMY